MFFERERGGSFRHRGGGRPDHMKDDPVEGRVDVMPVPAPVAHLQVDLDVAADWRGVPDLKHGMAEIGSGLTIPETGMKDANRAAVQGSQFLAVQALVMPDGLEESFGRGAAARFAEPIGTGTEGAPPGVKGGERIAHGSLLFPGDVRNVKWRSFID